MPPYPQDQDYDSLLRNSEICEFDFSELYRVQEIQPSAKSDGGSSSVYGRVRMHENLPNTRLLLVSSLRERREQIDEEIDQMLEAREARDSVTRFCCSNFKAGTQLPMKKSICHRRLVRVCLVRLTVVSSRRHSTSFCRAHFSREPKILTQVLQVQPQLLLVRSNVRPSMIRGIGSALR